MIFSEQQPKSFHKRCSSDHRIFNRKSKGLECAGKATTEECGKEPDVEWQQKSR